MATLFEGLQINAKQPADLKMIVDTIIERDNLANGIVYEGMLVYVRDDNTYYVLTTENNSPGTWVELGSGGGGGSNVAEFIDFLNDPTNSQFWVGTLLEYNALVTDGTVSDDVYYYITDDFVEGATLDAPNAATWAQEGNNDLIPREKINYKSETKTLTSTDATVDLFAVNVIPSGTSALTITTPTPTPGCWYEVSNLSGDTTNRIAAGGRLVQGNSTDLVLDDDTASFRLTYFNDTIGWVVTGAN